VAEPGPPPQAVLFVCRHNVIRSPMAAAIARQMFPRSMYVRSAGLERGTPDPFAVAAMEEIGLDIAGRESRTLEDLADTSFDLVVTLAPEAHHRVLELARTESFDVEYWPTLDPTVTEGSREQILDAYRAVRDGLRRRIDERFGPARTS
jgi:protein-tyrosine-phosphatase